MAQVAYIDEFKHWRQPRLVLEREKAPCDFLAYKARRNCEVRAGVYRVSVNRSTIPLELAGVELFDQNYIRTTDNVVALGMRDVELFRIEKETPKTYVDILNELAFHQYRPATRCELFAFAAKCAYLARANPIVALGTTASDERNERLAMVLEYHDDKPVLLWRYCESLQIGTQLLVGYKPYGNS